MRHHRTLLAIATVGVLLTACNNGTTSGSTTTATTSSTDATPSATGITLPAGMTDLDEIRQALADSTVAVIAVGRDSGSREMGRVTFHPNGDASIEIGGETYLQIGDTMYISGPDNTWSKITGIAEADRFTLSGTMFSDGEPSYTVTENPDGYTITAAYPANPDTGSAEREDTNQLIVNGDRVLTQVISTTDGITDIITISYEADFTPLEAPEGAIDTTT